MPRPVLRRLRQCYIAQMRPRSSSAIFCQVVEPSPSWHTSTQRSKNWLAKGASDFSLPNDVLRHGLIDQSHVGLMHQRRRLQRLPRLLVGQLRRSQPAQFVIDERQQLFRRQAIAGFDLGQDVRDVGHGH